MSQFFPMTVDIVGHVDSAQLGGSSWFDLSLN